MPTLLEIHEMVRREVQARQAAKQSGQAPPQLERDATIAPNPLHTADGKNDAGRDVEGGARTRR